MPKLESKVNRSPKGNMWSAIPNLPSGLESDRTDFRPESTDFRPERASGLRGPGGMKEMTE